MAACAGDGGGGSAGTPRDQLLALPMVAGVGPATTFFQVKNNRTLTFTWRHSDSAQTTFATLTFTPRSIALSNGLYVCDTCTVTVSVSWTSGLYGFTIGPPTVVFATTNSPVVTVSYGAYGDLSVYDSTPAYPTPGDFSQALDVWYERSPGAWVEGRNSSHTAPTAVTSALESTGTYLLAAPK